MQESEVTLQDSIKTENHENKYLSFKLGKEEYGINIKYITEIIGLQNITHLPELPVYVKGVINLRGKVIPVIDVRLRFGKEERAYDERTCMIVTHINEMSVGLIVDMVSEVLDIASKQIDPPPKMSKSAESRFIQGLGKVEEEVKIILDINNLLYEDDMELIANVNQN